MKNNNILQLNMARDNYDSFNNDYQIAMGMMEAKDITTNKVQVMNAIMVRFKDLEYLQLLFFKEMHDYIENKHVYNLGIMINEKEKMFFLCDHKYHIPQNKFKKIYKDLLKNLSEIEDFSKMVCSSMYFIKTKQEMEEYFKEIMKGIKENSIDVNVNRGF